MINEALEADLERLIAWLKTLPESDERASMLVFLGYHMGLASYFRPRVEVMTNKLGEGE